MRSAGSTYLYKETAMALLIVNLQDGFEDDVVVVKVNDQEVFHKEGVKTKLLIGYADSFEVKVADGSVNVEVILPLRNLSETIVLEVSTVAYLGLSMHEGRIDYLISNEPFGYL